MSSDKQAWPAWDVEAQIRRIDAARERDFEQRHEAEPLSPILLLATGLVIGAGLLGSGMAAGVMASRYAGHAPSCAARADVVPN